MFWNYLPSHEGSAKGWIRNSLGEKENTIYVSCVQ